MSWDTVNSFRKHNTTKHNARAGVGVAGSVNCAEVVALQRVKTQVACGEMQGFAVYKVLDK
ncbi:hypothetical protein GH733_004828 [Mirounga leonina]|nr:hypothetical protein GH733_004828 [Mirounga leonina]